MSKVSLINGHIDGSNTCVICGRDIPEGSQVCVICGNTKPRDMVEVKHGKWQEEKWCDNFQHTCSICHSTVRVHPRSVAYKYCPYCGAKMDGERRGKE